MVRAQQRSPDSLAERVARRISAARRAKNLTQDDVARTMGIATKNYQRVESGRQNLTLKTIEQIAKALGADADELLTTDAPVSAWDSLRSTGITVLDADAAPPKPAVPVYSLAAAAGALGHKRTVERLAWAMIPKLARASVERHFAAQVVGSSMEPMIPDGAWCLFRTDIVGAIEGRIVLLQHRDQSDPESEGAFTLKRLKNVEVGDEGVSVRLESINPKHPAFSMRLRALEELRPVAEFVRVLAPRVTSARRR